MAKKDQIEQAGEELVKAQTQEVGFVAEFEEDAGLGAQFTMDEVQIPYLSIIQSNSPQLKRGNEKYIQGATASDLLNTASGTVISGEKGIDVIAAGHLKLFIEWVPRDLGGGFVQNHLPNSPAVSRAMANGWKLPNGNIIRETVVYPCLANWEGHWINMLISMASTQLKKSRQWNTKVQNLKLQGSRGLFTPPIFSHVYHLTTVFEQNKKGDFFGWKVDLARPLNMQDQMEAEMYKFMKRLNQEILEGAFRVGPPPTNDDAENDEVPFGG